MNPSGTGYLKEVEIFHDGSLFQHGRIMAETLKYQNQMEAYGLKFRFIKNKFYPRISMDSRTLYTSVVDHLSREFYHWFIDAAPRLLAIEENAPKLTLLLNEYYRRDYIQ